MITNKYFLLSLVLFFLHSCNTNEAEFLPTETLENLYIELQMAEEKYNQGYQEDAESTLMKLEETRNEIFEFYQTDSNQFYESIKYYESEKEKIKQIFEEVEAKLDSIRAKT